MVANKSSDCFRLMIFVTTAGESLVPASRLLLHRVCVTVVSLPIVGARQRGVRQRLYVFQLCELCEIRSSSNSHLLQIIGP